MYNSLDFNKNITGFYPERHSDLKGGLESFIQDYPVHCIKKITNRWNGFSSIVNRINTYGNEVTRKSDSEIFNKSQELRLVFRKDGFSIETVAQSFALIREVAERKLGMRHYDVQLLGGWVLFNSMVAEMETGEGKTITATLPACTVALSGVPVHVITVNDYLAERDALWMEPIYKAFGLSVGLIKHGMTPAERKQAYNCDVTYCTNKELVFDYLKDHLLLKERPGHIKLPLLRVSDEARKIEKLCLRGLGYAIVDEADSVLIDEAKTPLIISGSGNNSFEEDVYHHAMDIAGKLTEEDDFVFDQHNPTLELTDLGKEKIQELSSDKGKFWHAKRIRELLVYQALVGRYLFHKDKDYIIKDGKIQIVDEYTGRLMSDRSWEKGLHQMIESKEGCEISPQREILARMSYQRFFRRYHWLSGMTGTAKEVSQELWSVYNLQVQPISTNKKLNRRRMQSQIFINEKEKFNHIVERIKELHGNRRPVLVGTPSVAVSERLSGLLEEKGLQHRVLNARQDKDEAEIIAEAGQKNKITIATNMAGRGTDIVLGPEVAKIGGLHVLASEPHSARRIDRQLYGRSGRQGDPGSYEGCASLEDDILAPYASSLIGLVMRKTIGYNLPWKNLFSRMFIRSVQKSIEKKHYAARKALLKFDASMESTLAFSGKGE